MLSFHRQISIGLKLKKPLSNGRQGLSFSIAAGFSAPIEALTGMSVSLPLVDRWLEEERRNFENQDFSSTYLEEFEVALEVLRLLQKSLASKSSTESVQLAKLEADFYDFKILWDLSNGFLKTETFQVEVLSSLGSYGRCEVTQTSEVHSKAQSFAQTNFSSLAELLKALSDSKSGSVSYLVHDLARSEQWRV